MHFPRNWQSYLALLHDLVMAAISLWLAHFLRLGDYTLEFSGHLLQQATLPFVALTALVFIASGLYRGLWRYASMQDLITLSRATFLLIVVFYLALFFLVRLEGTPRSVPIIHWLLLLAMLGSSRFAYRFAKDRRLGLDFTLAAPPKVPVLLIGANDAAELFIRESRRNPQAAYHVVGLVDDDDKKRGRQVHGVRIYGATEVLSRIVHKLNAKGRHPQRIILAESRPSGDRVRALLKESDRLGLPLSRIPQTLELQSEASEKIETRPIAIEDLLRRSQKVHDTTPVASMVKDRTILITGAGGTIGGELVRQLASYHPRKLILLEHAEFQLYQIERELADHFPDCEMAAALGDIRDEGLLEDCFKTHQPEIVFHAAALKHVPLSEENPIECVRTNALGTWAVARMAAKHDVKAMVLISTDKAVKPENVMGASKRLAEKVMQTMGHDSLRRNQTKFITVRFGNVLGSTGSVVPRFQQQIAAGGPITVTHADMTRYFMTVREAVELVLQSASLGLKTPEDNGGIYVLDMGEPVKINELARQMILLSGLGEDEITITYTGLRAGEKMHEELFYDNELPKPTSHESIRLTKPSPQSLSDLKRELMILAKQCEKRDAKEVLVQLQHLVKH